MRFKLKFNTAVKGIGTLLDPDPHSKGGSGFSWENECGSGSTALLTGIGTRISIIKCWTKE